nr:cysteine peptidase family C39 domain-containing protein [Mycoplasma sp. Ms02]
MKQYNSLDCSLSVLSYFINLIKDENVPISCLKEGVEYKDEGINLKEFSKVAKKNGLKASFFDADFDNLLKINKKLLPIAVLVKKDKLMHMIILLKVHKYNTKIFDPALGYLTISNDEFKKTYQNIVICFENQNLTEKNIKRNGIPTINLFELFIGLLCSLPTFLIPIFLRYTIKFTFNTFSFETLFKSCSIVLAILLITLVLETVKETLSKHISTKRYEAFVNSYLKSHLETNNGFVNGKSIFDIKKNLEETCKFFEIQGRIIAKHLPNVLTFFFGLVVCLSVSYPLFCVLISLYFVLFIGGLFFRYKIKKKFYEIIESTKVYERNFLDLMFFSKNVSTKTYRNWVLFNFKNTQNKLLKLSLKLSQQTILKGKFEEFMKILSVIVIFFIGCILSWKNLISSEMLLFFVMNTSLLLMPILKLVCVFGDLKDFRKSKELFLDLQNDINQEKHRVESSDKYLTLKDIYFKRDKRLLFECKKIELKENLIIKGPNGCGKTTFLKVLAQKIVPDFGSVLTPVFKSKITSIFSDEYIPNQTVLQYLMNVSEKNKDTVLSKLKEYNVEYVLEFIGLNLDKNLIDNASNISLGQRRFIQILRLILSKYNYILLDEVLDGLEEKVVRFLVECIRYEQKDAIFIEVNHSGKYVAKKYKVLDFEKLNN